jgi:hypothetical protein
LLFLLHNKLDLLFLFVEIRKTVLHHSDQASDEAHLLEIQISYERLLWIRSHKTTESSRILWEGLKIQKIIWDLDLINLADEPYLFERPFIDFAVEK